jgi:predicted amidohydrolase
LCHPERDEDTLDLYISVYVIASDGAILGTHRKTCVIPEVEAWSNRGGDPSPVIVPPVQTGILICADAYTARASERLRERGAQLLISSAAWGPRPHGPERCWEERSRETGLPLFVCNRTGKDRALDFWEAESVVVNDGKRLLSYSGFDSTVILINWNLETQALMDHTIRKLAVGPLTEP